MTGAWAGIDGLVVGREVGGGAFGRVYLAEEPDHGRRVALKVLTGVVADEASRRRFDRERRAAGALSDHPCIATIYRSGYDADGRAYLVMEYAPGGSLADRLRRDGPLGAAEVLEVGVKLAGAVETAHRAGVIHRDIKPENVLVAAGGEPKLTDFGIASLADATSSAAPTAGTLAYMAPELLDGAAASPASDIYALGATLYALSAGRAPFLGDADSNLAAVMRRILDDEPADLAGVGTPAPLRRVIERAMAKAPAERFAAASELGEVLRAAQAELGLAPTTLVVRTPTTGATGPAEATEAWAAAPPAAAPLAGLAAAGDAATLTSFAGAAPEPLTHSGAGAGTPRWRRPKALAAAAAALVVLAGAGVVAARQLGGEQGRELSTAAADPTPTTDLATTTTTAAPTTVAPTSTEAPPTSEAPPPAPAETTAPPPPAPTAPPTPAPTTAPPPPPSAAIGASTASARVGQAVAFTDRSSGQLTARQWDFGDGQTGAGAQVSHSWAAPGTFVVTLTVTDRLGRTASATTVVEVRPPRPTVAITGPNPVCAGQRSLFTGSATDAVSGTWSLPNYRFNDPSWRPDAPTQFIQPTPDSRGFNTWTLQVQNSVGETAQAQFTFEVVAC